MRNILLFTFGFVTLGTLSVIEAGPPLICHPYSIGGAKSLPWGDGSDWNNPAPSYNVTKLANDTFGLLDETTPVLVRMETLRRATLYGAKDHDQARALLARLAERVKAAEESTKSSASALFDYGYFLSSLYQVAWLYKEDITGGIDGYAIVTKALVIDPSSPEMHFAAALMTFSPPRPSEREEHLRKARAAKHDELLAENLSTHFQ